MERGWWASYAIKDDLRCWHHNVSVSVKLMHSDRLSNIAFWREAQKQLKLKTPGGEILVGAGSVKDLRQYIRISYQAALLVINVGLGRHM